MTKIGKAAPPTAEIVNLADRRKRQSEQRRPMPRLSGSASEQVQLRQILDEIADAWLNGPAHRLVQASKVSWAGEINSVPLPSASIENYRAFCAERQDKP